MGLDSAFGNKKKRFGDQKIKQSSVAGAKEATEGSTPFPKTKTKPKTDVEQVIGRKKIAGDK